MRMRRKVKIVLIGAGSKEFSKGLIHDLVLENDIIENIAVEVVLVDLHEATLRERLEYARECARQTGASIEIKACMDRRTALPKADFVLLSVAIGRMELWEQDFRIPLGFGVRQIYGENGGPGAVFHALRNFELIFPILKDIEDLCPDALLINFTNPEARILTAILKLTKLNAIGLCHGFYSFHRFAGDTLGYNSEDLDIRTAGLNHFYTYYRITDKRSGKDLSGEFEKRITEKAEKLPPVVRYLWRTFGVIGYISDLHVGEYLGYAHELVGTKWKFGIESRKVVPGKRGIDSYLAFDAWREGKDIETYLVQLEEYQNQLSSGNAEFDGQTKIQKSGELAVPIIGDILLDRKILRPAVNVLNTQGYIENLSREGCIEVPAIVDAEGIHPEFVGKLPEGFAAQIRLQHSIQHLLVDAYAKRSKKLLIQAILLDPVYVSPQHAEDLLEYMLGIQSAYLPCFS
jgi:alpha-galactosidase